MFAEAIEALLADQCTPATVRAVDAGASPAALWRSFEEAGFLDLLTPEDRGGAALPLNELFAIVALLGRHAAPIPLAQGIAARALLPSNLAVPPGMGTLATSLRRDPSGAIACSLTPCGQMAAWVLARDGGDVLLLPTARAEVTASGVHLLSTASLRWADGDTATRIPGAGASLSAWACALHAGLLSGAMARVFDMTLQHCNDRVQFGKSLGKFQAVQHQLSVMAEHVAAASMAAEMAFQADGPAPQPLAAAIAKSRTSEAAAAVAAIAHALHGAIGVTEEYDLQLWTRRLHEWRMAHGSEDCWNLFVGQQVLGSQATLSDFVRAAA